MDERTVRLHLEEVKRELERNEEEHEVLSALLRGYEGWLRLHAQHANGVAHAPIEGQLVMPAVKEEAKSASWRSTVKAILMEARGEPVHTREILARAQARGLRTISKNPRSATDLTLRSLPGVEKIGPRLWRWVGDNLAPKDREKTKGSGVLVGNNF